MAIRCPGVFAFITISSPVEPADIDLAVGCLPADVGVMKDADHRRAAKLCLGDQFDNGPAVAGVEAGGRLVEQKKPVGIDEAARNVDPLLFAAAEGQRGQRPQIFRDAKAGQQFAGTLLGLGFAAAGPNEGFGDDLDRWNAGNTRRNWLI